MRGSIGVKLGDWFEHSTTIKYCFNHALYETYPKSAHTAALSTLCVNRHSAAFDCLMP